MFLTYFLFHKFFILNLVKLFLKIFELSCLFIGMNTLLETFYIKEVGIASKICLLNVAP
jgi:hypothetical protein